LRIAICIGTFRRPQLLQRLLAALGELRFRGVDRPTIEVIVVDNDVARTALEICGGASLPWTVRYVCEPQRGIARVRNRAIREAGDFDFLAFIDDDEIPDPCWLDELLATQARFSADVVSGPVLPIFADGAPEWIRAGGFFARPLFATGDLIGRCSTNNVLIRKNVFASVAGFDERFNLTGGEDTHFFLHVRHAGHSMVWSGEAAVRESVPRERTNIAWILRRGYQSGNSWVLCELALYNETRVWWMRFAKSLAHMVNGTATFLLSLPSGKAATVRSLRRVCLGAGMLAALLGHRFLPYQDSGSDPVGNAAKVGTPV
jgi:glycosyltransferase involved in cell wall biosynthesis